MAITKNAAAMACHSLTSDTGVVSTRSIGPMAAPDPLEGEHLTQREYWAEYLEHAQRDAREQDRRVREAQRKYEIQSRQAALLGQAFAFAMTAQMLNGMADHLKGR